MKELFYEFIKEAKDGRVIIDNEEWYYSFNTIILEEGKEKLRLENEENNIALIIKNETSFFKLLEEYINLEIKTNRKTLNVKSEKDKIKTLLCHLFVNGTTEDFINPERFIRRYIAFLKDETFSYLDKGLETNTSNILDGTKLEIKREQNSTYMETPHKISPRLKNEEDIYELPSIYYGIKEENGIKTCYIYGIQASKNNDPNNQFTKKVNRMLYKINEGVEDIEEYYDYKNGISDYYPEANISDVTMSFILSLNIFITLLQIEKIEQIKAIPYLPVRYNGRMLAAKRANKEEYQTRNDQIQKNLTNKFIRTFRRLEKQNSSVKVYLYPYEQDEFLSVRVNPKRKKIKNKILEESSNEIKKYF